MRKSERTGAEIGATPDQKQTNTRTPRAIRFSDSEWDEVKTAAAEHKIPAAEVRPRCRAEPRPEQERRGLRRDAGQESSR